MELTNSKTIVMAAAAAALCAALAGCATQPSNVTVEAPTSDNVITVSASAELKAVPDKARIGVSVTVQADTADEAQAQGAETVNAVIDALQAAGVAETSIQTSWTNLNPRYGYAEPIDESYSEAVYVGGGNDIVGYDMYTRLQVSDLDIDEVGAIIEAAVAAGATGSDGVEYYTSDYDELYANALADAVEASRGKAEVLADAAGVMLGKVVSVQEGWQDTSARYTYAADEATATAGSASMKIAPGQVSVQANVTVSYSIG